MKIIIDEREHGLFEKCQVSLISMSSSSTNTIEKQVLPLGDILFKTNDDVDILLIERKSFSDLLSSIKDGRYEEQSYRLLHSSGLQPHNIFYLIEGMFSQLRYPTDKRIIYSAMTTLQYFKGFSTQRTTSIQESAEWIIYMADKIERELAKGTRPQAVKTDDASNTDANYCSVVKKVKKDNITPDNIGEIILCQIPGISSVTAISIMKQYPNFPTFMEEIKKNPNCLDNLLCENGNGVNKPRKISKAVCESIRKYLIANMV